MYVCICICIPTINQTNRYILYLLNTDDMNYTIKTLSSCMYCMYVCMLCTLPSYVCGLDMFFRRLSEVRIRLGHCDGRREGPALSNVGEGPHEEDH